MLKLKQKLQPMASPASVDVQLLVINNSSKTVKSGGKWAVKDEDTETVREARFGTIPPGGSQERYVNLPTGVEWGIFRFEAEDGSRTWAAPHGGNNTEAYKLELDD